MIEKVESWITYFFIQAEEKSDSIINQSKESGKTSTSDKTLEKIEEILLATFSPFLTKSNSKTHQIRFLTYTETTELPDNETNTIDRIGSIFLVSLHYYRSWGELKDLLKDNKELIEQINLIYELQNTIRSKVASTNNEKKLILEAEKLILEAENFFNKVKNTFVKTKELERLLTFEHEFMQPILYPLLFKIDENTELKFKTKTFQEKEKTNLTSSFSIYQKQKIFLIFQRYKIQKQMNFTRSGLSNYKVVTSYMLYPKNNEINAANTSLNLVDLTFLQNLNFFSDENRFQSELIPNPDQVEEKIQKTLDKINADLKENQKCVDALNKVTNPAILKN